MEIKDCNLQISIPRALLEKIEKIGEEEKRTVDSQITYFLRERVRQYQDEELLIAIRRLLSNRVKI